MKNKLKKWVAVIGLMAFCLLAIGGAAGADVRELSPQDRSGARLQAQEENSTSKPNDPGNSAVVDGGFLSKAGAWAKHHGVGLLYGAAVGAVVGLAVAGIAMLVVATSPFWVIVGIAAVAGGVYGLITGAVKFDVWDCVLFSAIAGVSAAIGTGLAAAGVSGWALLLGRGAVDVVGGGLAMLGSYLLHTPNPTWGGAGQAFAIGAATAAAALIAGAAANKLFGPTLARLGGKLRTWLPWGRGAGAAAGEASAVGGTAGRGSSAVAEGVGPGSGSALEAEAAVTAEGAVVERVGSEAGSSVAEAPTATPPRGPASRPSWRDSELAVGDDLMGNGYEAQQSFRDGELVPYGTRGSSRPEYFKTGSSVEVKNYDVSSAQGRSNLARNISGQAMTRLVNLPSGTEQSVIIDVRGQSVSPDTLEELARRISELSGGAIRRENIKFKW